MAILRERTRWRRKKVERKWARPDDLTPDEQDHVRRAIGHLYLWFGTWQALAAAMGIAPATLKLVMLKTRRRRPSAGYALRAAKVAKVRVETILSGRWPTPSTPAKPFRVWELAGRESPRKSVVGQSAADVVA